LRAFRFEKKIKKVEEKTKIRGKGSRKLFKRKKRKRSWSSSSIIL